jgi:hypothetical protein
VFQYTDCNSKFYGKLVNWYSHGAWHYGIGLSNDYIFDLGENLKNLDISSSRKNEKRRERGKGNKTFECFPC